MVRLKSSFKGIKVDSEIINIFDPKMTFKENLETAASAIKNSITDKEISTAGIYIGIPRDMAIIRSLTLPSAVKENLHDTLAYEMEKYVPIPVDDIYFDSQITFEDQKTNMISVLLIVAKKKDFEPVFGFVNRLGFGVSGVEIGLTALLNYFSIDPIFKDETDYGIIFNDSDAIEMGLVQNRMLHTTKSINISSLEGNNPDQMILEGIRSLQGDSCVDSIKKVAVCGHEKYFGHKIRQVNGTEFISPDPDSLGLTGDKSFSAFGLALKGIKKVPMTLNLLPMEIRKTPKRTGYYVSFILSGLVCLLVLVWAGSSFMYQRQAKEMQEIELKRLSDEVARISRIKEQSEELERRIDTIHEMTSKRVVLLDVLNEITSVLPSSSWVYSFDFNDDNLQIEGVSQSASALIPLLEASTLFKDVVFLSTITKDKNGMEKFRIGLKVIR